jgi:hypothetical protein
MDAPVVVSRNAPLQRSSGLRRAGTIIFPGGLIEFLRTMGDKTPLPPT